MKLITRNTDYAIRALGYMSKRNGRMISAEELVNELGIPRSFLRKILQVLNKKKLLKSHKGRRGGFIFTGSPEKIMLVDVIEIFQGPLKLSGCIFKKRICPDRDSCALKGKIDEIEKSVVDRLRSTTLASVLR